MSILVINGPYIRIKVRKFKFLQIKDRLFCKWRYDITKF